MSRTYRHAPLMVQLHQDRRRQRGRKRFGTIPHEYARSMAGIGQLDLVSPLEMFRRGEIAESLESGNFCDTAEELYDPLATAYPRYHYWGEEPPLVRRRERRAANTMVRGVTRDPGCWDDLAEL